MFDDEILTAAIGALEAARRRGVMIVTVESCTGGLLAGALTSVAGSSDAVDGGYVTYANAAKSRLGVPTDVLEAHGAVSPEAAEAMAEAGMRAVRGTELTHVAISITGVAGPGGGSEAKPVGLVHFACVGPAGASARTMRYGDIGRNAVRRESVLTALQILDAALAE